MLVADSHKAGEHAGHTLSVILERLQRACESQSEPNFLNRVKNESSSGPGKYPSSYDFKLEMDSHILYLPGGLKKPASVLGSDIEGLEFDGSDIEAWRQSTGACIEGTVDFLQHFGIAYETEGGSYECCECGSEADCGEPETISYCADFVVSEKMARALEAQGYLDGTLEWMGESGVVPCDIETLLADQTDSEILERLKPAEDGVKFDATKWRFVANLESIEGLDDLETADLIRASILLDSIVKMYIEAGQLPPIGGRLVPIGSSPNSSRAPYLDWLPDAGMLEHPLINTIGDGALLRFSATTKSVSLVVGGIGGFPCEIIGADIHLTIDASMGSPKSALALAIHRSAPRY